MKVIVAIKTCISYYEIRFIRRLSEKFSKF
jgi:hypothetical protein